STLPVCPPVAQGHACQACHEVQLARPHETMQCRERPELPIYDPVVMRESDLRRDVVLLEAKVRGCRRENVSSLARWKASQFRHIVLDNEAAAAFQVSGGVSESLDLLVLSGQVRDRVAQEVDEAERGIHLDSREVADRETDGSSARLRLQFGN